MAARADFHRPWHLAPGAMGPSDLPVLAFGGHAIPLAEATSYGFTERRDWDVDGQMLNFAAYMGAACVFLLLVTVGEWRDRFLIGTACFGILGLMALTDVFNARVISVYEVTIARRGAAAVTFSTGSLQEAQRICALLAEHGVRRV